MSPVQAMSSEPLRRHRLTVEDYYKMGEVGIINEKDRVELIEGEIIDMVPIGSNHAYTINKILNLFLMKQLSGDIIVRIQDPLLLDEYNEPEPDIALVVNQNYYSRHPGPAETLLIIEVADSSLAYDLDIKTPLYARHDIPEVWVINLTDKKVHVFDHPGNGAYQNQKELNSGKLTPGNIKSLELDLEELREK